MSKIGNLEIFPEQTVAASEVIKVFRTQETNDPQGPPILVAQMQQGKTGASVEVADLFLGEWQRNRGLSCFILYIVNIADNALRDQTEERFERAGLPQSSYEIIHHAAIKKQKIEKLMKYDRVLIIMDECHIALGSGKAPLHNFLKAMGILYGLPVRKWVNRRAFVLSVSATPYAQIIQTKIDDSCFRPIAMRVSEHYFSLQHLFNSGRIKQSESVWNEDGITDFFKSRLIEFLESCRENGNGHMVVRVTKEGPQGIINFVRTNHGDAIDIKIFDSKRGNIGKVDDFLSTVYPKPTIVIIKGALRAGKTLTTTQYLRMWIESKSSKGDTMCQAVGRCLGYEFVNGANRKFQDTFPIYCNMVEIRTAIEFYDSFGVTPSGVQNNPYRRKGRVNGTLNFRVSVFDNDADDELEGGIPSSTKGKELLIHEKAIRVTSEYLALAKKFTAQAHPDWTEEEVEAEVNKRKGRFSLYDGGKTNRGIYINVDVSGNKAGHLRSYVSDIERMYSELDTNSNEMNVGDDHLTKRLGGKILGVWSNASLRGTAVLSQNTYTINRKGVLVRDGVEFTDTDSNDYRLFSQFIDKYPQLRGKHIWFEIIGIGETPDWVPNKSEAFDNLRDSLFFKETEHNLEIVEAETFV